MERIRFEKKMIKTEFDINGKEIIIYKNGFLACHKDHDFCWKHWKACQKNCAKKCFIFDDYVMEIFLGKLPILKIK
jgi:hypothetical protein